MITTAEMLDLEAESGIPIIRLMENAGKAFADALRGKFNLNNKKIKKKV